MYAKLRWLIGLALIGLAMFGLPMLAQADGGDNVSTATLLQPGITVYGEGNYDGSSPDRRRFWSVDLSAGDKLTVDYTWTGGGGPDDLTMCLLNPGFPDSDRITSSECSLVDQAALEEPRFVDYISPATGRWVIELWDCVDFCNAQRWTYTLTVYVTPLAQQAPPPKPSKPSKSSLVVACCDSFASGEGTQAFPAINSGCHRTDQAWPNSLPYPVVNTACSGAKISALFTSFKGQAPQLNQMKSLKPGIVVMMEGGNDALYGAALHNCYLYNCAAGKLNQNFDAIRLLRSKLAGAYEAVAEATKAKLFVVGYPRVFPLYPAPIVNCGWLSNAERLMLTTLGNELQQAEIGAVSDANKSLALRSKARIQFVSTMNVLAGHELCSSRSWMFKIDLPACLKDARCGHPTAPGQEAIAAAVRKPLKAYAG